MKNAFKFGFLAVAISLSVAACNSEKSGETTDTTVTDSSTIVTEVDTMSTATSDSAAVDSVKVTTEEVKPAN